jgi:hypothetical protein
MPWNAQSFTMLAKSLNIKAFRPHFGFGSDVCATVWSRIIHPDGAEPPHLLWTLLFLKVYASEEVISNLVGVCRNTYRKWVWPMLSVIQQMESQVVSSTLLTFENWFPIISFLTISAF